MNPVDAAGNMLNEKDPVCINISGLVKGQVAKVREAGILMGKSQPMPGSITILVPITIQFDPRYPQLQNVFKIVKPPDWDRPEN
jgi:hypothetical protein